MLLIVQKKDNDDIFTELLSKKSGRAQAKKSEAESHAKCVNTIQISPTEISVIDRTSPKKVNPRGHF